MTRTAHDIATEEVAAAWQGEGWYEITWSGCGQQQWDPWWCEWEDELIDVLESAYNCHQYNEYNLPGIGYHGDGEEPWANAE